MLFDISGNFPKRQHQEPQLPKFPTSQLPNYNIYNFAKSCDNLRKHPITPYATFGTFDFLFIACIGGAAGGGLSIAQWIGLM